MGRTMPSFRIALAMERREWKPFRDMLDKADRKLFDEMFDAPRLYLSACSYSVQTVRLYPILMSILLHCYKELVDCIDQMDRLAFTLGIKANGEDACKHELIPR